MPSCPLPFPKRPTEVYPAHCRLLSERPELPIKPTEALLGLRFPSIHQSPSFKAQWDKRGLQRCVWEGGGVGLGCCGGTAPIHGLVEPVRWVHDRLNAFLPPSPEPEVEMGLHCWPMSECSGDNEEPRAGGFPSHLVFMCAGVCCHSSSSQWTL